MSAATHPCRIRFGILMVMLAFTSVAGVRAQQAAFVDVETITIGCRDEPLPKGRISLRVKKSWIRDNALFADLTIANRTDVTIRLPRKNVGGHYWDAVILTSTKEPILYCGGVSEASLDPVTEIVSDADIVTVAPGHAITLAGIYLAPFWPYLDEPERDAKSFQVVYTGWASIPAYFAGADRDKLLPLLEGAKQRQCSLYGSEFTSAVQPLLHRRAN